ncbi:NPCBM/NEW2 domain-containing protein [Mucilaginibacter myungsuensis]|uniref:NPCBM/NEW2 domain-containing protein n=1 Tax=Mucilaginibacter myungsuensis TaxID=649104 RepID=A0A929PXJ3_9SPHI|nr:NPCBM/NEW2 domain-containing protein [Mucilaginibacter myungsuensis]MBE9663214.1 NPCBM/NEW2 domain-containing protein [Mucilaginibacter myungsuensis]MDN3598847.1 NPCBM/NEW2 domain-containing protein [Mucilaginibacter myungsuensis]
MSRPYLSITVSITLLLLATFPSTGFSQLRPYGKAIIADAQKLIKKYHASAPKANNVVKVVYFHGRDQDPLPNWEERLDRTLTAVNDFFVEEFKQAGMKTDGVNFEKVGKKYVITVIRGDLDAKNYDGNSGAAMQAEIGKKANGKINFDTDHVVVLAGLSYQRDDGVHILHSPYWGIGSSERGICFVADNEMLDAKYLTDKTTRMRFMEANVKDCLVAEFNSWFIGGIAHEMGHMLGLPHDFGNPAELTPSTISLMGQFGSRHFNDYLWDGSQTAHISAAGLLQLASHPVFTKSRKDINTHTPLNVSDMQLHNRDSSIQLKTTVSGGVLPYGLSVLMHPTTLHEYFNESSIYRISAAGAIDITLNKKPVGTYRMAFIFMFPNGTLEVAHKLLRIAADGAELIDIPGASPLDIKDFYSRLSKKEPTAPIKQKLNIIEGILKADPPADPETIAGNSLYLSDAKWEEGKVGWADPARNYYSTEAEYTFFLENQDKLFSKGLMAHSPSSYVFRLNYKWKQFSGIVGLRDQAHQQGSARFTVIGDGRVLYTSPNLRVGQRAYFNIDIHNINFLQLKTEGTEGHSYNSWASWFDPLISR